MSRRAAQGGPVSTITNTADRPPTIGVDPIMALWVPALAMDIALPFDLRFAIGRLEDNAVRINHPGVSRQHADAERDGNNLRITNRSKNGIEFDGAMIGEFTIKPGEMMKLDQVEVFALTRSMVGARQRLAYQLGYGPESLAMPMLQAAARGASFVVAGPIGTPRYDVACALIDASPRQTARRREVIAGQVPAGEAVRDIVAKTTGGVVYVDGQAVETMPGKDRAMLAELLGEPRWNVMLLWSCERLADARAITSLRAVPMMQIEIPTVAARIARRELPAMIDHLLTAMAVGHRARDLDRSPHRPNLRALEACDWPDNHAELRLCVGYLGHRLNGASQEQIADMLGVGLDGKRIDRSKLRRMVGRWGVSL